MQISKNKTAAIAIAMLLAFLMGSSLVLVQPAKATTGGVNLPTYAYINAEPNPAGVGQSVLVIMWLTNIFSPATGLGNDYRFHNYELFITPPNGTKTEVTFSYVADSTSDQDYSFTPNIAGTWTLNFTFPGQPFNEYDHDTSYVSLFTGQTIPEPFLGDTYLPSSAQITITVQSTAVPVYPTTPLPTAYWTRPIYGYNSNWYAVSSNWLGSGSPVESCVGSGAIAAYGANSLFGGAALNRYPGDAVGSMTSHIMWTKPLDQGGIVGGDNFEIAGDSYFEGSAYIQRYDNPIIMDGVLIYTAPLGYDYNGAGQGGGTYAVNLQTGQQLWYSASVPALSFGYIYDAQNPNQKGVEQPILFTSSFGQAYDAWTGTYLFSCANMPSVGPLTMGPNGEILGYVITNIGTRGSPNWQLAEWNSSNIWNWNVEVGGGSPSVALSTFTLEVFSFATFTYVPVTYTNEVNLGAGRMYDYLGPLNSNGFHTAQNITITPASDIPTAPFSQIAAYYGNMILCESGTLPNIQTSLLNGAISEAPYEYFAINLNSSRTTVGSVMWTNTVQAAPGNVTVLLGPTDPATGVFTEGWQQTMQWVGYSLYTGKQIWGPTASQAPLDYYGNPITPLIQGQCAYGNLYSMGYAGILYCYNDQTGKLLWTYGNGGEGNSTKSGPNTPFGDYATFIQAVGNGVIYLVASEHTINTPIYKGATARAVNATSGAEIWQLSAYTGEFSAMSYAMADGYNTWFNGYDNQIYVVGRGPSETSVTAPSAGLASGQSVVISGTVMDISAGTTQTEQAADFPHGVPCASDASMQQWMAYVYQQQPCPSNFTGVPVTISVTDSNHNTRVIGTATTDGSGFYTLTWTPDIPGNFTVTATFAGNHGYYPSSDVTSFTVEQAAAAPTPTASPPASNVDTYVLGSAVAIIIVLVIIGVVIALMVRRPR
jgi:hypothetical protein